MDEECDKRYFFFLHRTYFLALVRHPPAQINAPSYLVEWQLVCRSSEVGIVTAKLYIYTFRCLYSNQAHSIGHAKRGGGLKETKNCRKKKIEKIVLLKMEGGGFEKLEQSCCLVLEFLWLLFLHIKVNYYDRQ